MKKDPRQNSGPKDALCWHVILCVSEDKALLTCIFDTCSAAGSREEFKASFKRA